MSGEHVSDTMDPPGPIHVPWGRRPMPGHAHGRVLTDLRRAVIELAGIRGWHVPHPAREASTGLLTGVVLSRPKVTGSEIGWPDLTLIRRQDRRLVFAVLAPDRPLTLSPRRQALLDLLGALQWDASSAERRRAELAIGQPAPSIEAIVWRPADLVAGVIDEVLR